MANGQEKPVERPEMRAAWPHQGGPLGSSGTAPASAGSPTIADDPSTGGTAPAADTVGAVTKSGDPDNAANKTEKSDLSHGGPAGGEEPGGHVPDDMRRGGEMAAAESGARETSRSETTTADGDKPGGGETASSESQSGKAPGGDGPDGDAAGGKPAGGETADGESKSREAAGAGGADAKGAGGETTGAAGGGAGAGKGRRLRRASPIRVVRHAGRSTSAWAKRPSGRLILPAIVAVLLVAAAGTAGAYLVPQALQAAPSPSVTPGFPLDATAGSGAPQANLPTGSAPAGAGGLPPTIAPGLPAQNGARPADALTGWASQTGTKVGIPVVAVEAYGYAELVVARTIPTCHLNWTTIAAIAKVESSHGSANGSVLGADGMVQPPIYGLPLDGKGGRQLIRDTDQGTVDGDPSYDRAVGPLQFIPSTWLANKVDADNNGVADPNDIDDASLTAANYLCHGGRDLSKGDSWWDAILSYNAIRPYAQKVFDAANDYGQRSRG